MISSKKDFFINDFAIRSFRNIGDLDYIAARMAYRTKLYPQFLWSGQQAIEKFLKCILLLNRIKATKVRHSLSTALNLIEQNLSFRILLSKKSKETIEYFDTYGRFRYFETPYHIYGEHLPHFDKTIWELRRYCVVINSAPNETKESQFNEVLLTIEQSEKDPPQSFKQVDGVLEKLIADKKHPAREPLIWKNLYFGERARKRIKIQNFAHMENAPLFLSPELLDEIQQYVYLPKDATEAYRQVLRNRHK